LSTCTFHTSHLHPMASVYLNTIWWTNLAHHLKERNSPLIVTQLPKPKWVFHYWKWIVRSNCFMSIAPKSW
jgi:hypothetical protein